VEDAPRGGASRRGNDDEHGAWDGGTASPFGVKKKIAGLRLQATDAEWSVGDGQVATGSLEALVMAMAGRRMALDDLSGPGGGTPAEWLPTV
jgi:hypothetical protein